MRVVVTGGAGRSGSKIADHLRDRGAEVLTVDIVPARTGDAGSQIGSHLIADLEDLGQTVEALRGADAVLHLAAVWAQGVRPPTVTFDTNVRTTFNVFEAAALAGVRRVVWASTQSVVGTPWTDDNFPAYLPVDEVHPARPRMTYALSKHVGEQIAPYFAKIRGLEVLGLRLAWMIHEGGWGVVPQWQKNPVVASLQRLRLRRRARCCGRVCLRAREAGHRSACPQHRLRRHVHGYSLLGVGRSRFRGRPAPATARRVRDACVHSSSEGAHRVPTPILVA